MATICWKQGHIGPGMGEVTEMEPMVALKGILGILMAIP